MGNNGVFWVGLKTISKSEHTTSNLESKGRGISMLSRSVKIWVTVSLFSLLAYSSWLVRGSYAILFGYLAGVSGDVQYVSFAGAAFWTGHIGVTARFVGVLLGLATVFLLWLKSWPFSRVKNFVAAALFLEGLNFFGLIPSVPLLLSPDSPIYAPSLGYGYLLQVVFIVPFAWVLAVKVALYRDVSQGAGLLKFGAVAFAGYTVALFANEASRWTTMISADTLQFLLQGIRAVGFVNAVAVMPLAVVFAVGGVARVFQGREGSAMKWVGASLFVIGLGYVVYLVYSYFANSLNFAPLVDVWTVPLLGLGLALLVQVRRQRKKGS